MAAGRGGNLIAEQVQRWIDRADEEAVSEWAVVPRRAELTVYDEFSAGMGKQDKIRRLLEHCLRHDEVPLLIDRLRAGNPAQYEAHRDRLRG